MRATSRQRSTTSRNSKCWRRRPSCSRTGSSNPTHCERRSSTPPVRTTRQGRCSAESSATQRPSAFAWGWSMRSTASPRSRPLATRQRPLAWSGWQTAFEPKRDCGSGHRPNTSARLRRSGASSDPRVSTGCARKAMRFDCRRSSNRSLDLVRFRAWKISRHSQDPSMVEPPDTTRTFGRSGLAVIEGDITQVPADAIVNAANNAFAAGGGVDGAIRRAAGPELSGEMRRRYPAGPPTGSAVSTAAYALPARWVIHAVGPVWGRGGQDKLDLLASAYRTALEVADEMSAKTICSPAISAGTFGFPVEAAADVALRTTRDYLLGETGIERVTFVLRESAFETFRRRLATI